MTSRLWAEFLGTAFLLIGVVGSGIMGAALAEGNTAVAMLANAAPLAVSSMSASQSSAQFRARISILR